MAGTLSPTVFTVFDNSGLIVSGAKVFTYRTGTSTKQNTYTTALLSVANANPVVADSAGRVTMFLDPSLPNYDIVVASATSPDPPTSPLYTLSNVSAVPANDQTAGDITVTAGENITAGQTVYMSLGDGGKTVGRWYLTDADLAYASSNATALGTATADISSGSTGQVRISGQYTAASGLTAGTVYYLSGTAGALTSTAPSLNARAYCTAYSTTAYLLSWRQITTPRVLYVSTTQSGNIGGGLDTLATYTLPGGTMSVNGQVLRVTAWGYFAVNANDKRAVLNFGADSTAQIGIAAFNGVVWRITAEIVRTGAATQKTTSWTTPGSNLASQITASLTSATETLASDLDIRIRGESSSSATDDVVFSGMTVELLN